MTRAKRQRAAKRAAAWACRETRKVLVRDGTNAPGFVGWYACLLARLHREPTHRRTRVNLPPSSRPRPVEF